jgi:hypothetical protein
VRCPSDLDTLMLEAGGLWEPGSRCWLIERHAPIRCSGGQGSICIRTER